jgi:hypothetical protein
MRAELKRLAFDADPATLPGDAAEFMLLARMYVGPANQPGEESFDITVCTPEWLAEACRRAGGIYNPRHHLVINLESFDKRAPEAWLAQRVQAIQADTWTEVGERISRLGHWEFEDYRA